jgi:hypothetical protein
MMVFGMAHACSPGRISNGSSRTAASVLPVTVRSCCHTASFRSRFDRAGRFVSPHACCPSIYDIHMCPSVDTSINLDELLVMIRNADGGSRPVDTGVTTPCIPCVIPYHCLFLRWISNPLPGLWSMASIIAPLKALSVAVRRKWSGPRHDAEQHVVVRHRRDCTEDNALKSPTTMLR